jgi:hypothetical protein
MEDNNDLEGKYIVESKNKQNKKEITMPYYKLAANEKYR